jgi:hypothetical protein
MDLDALRQGDFSKLSQAITAWKGVVDRLQTLETDARDDLKAKADKANWAGVNATVSREFISKTAGEFSDAHTQAKSIHDILKDTHDELVDYKQQLDQALTRGRAKNLTVTPTAGGGFTVTMIRRRVGLPDHEQPHAHGRLRRPVPQQVRQGACRQREGDEAPGPLLEHAAEAEDELHR